MRFPGKATVAGLTLSLTSLTASTAWAAAEVCARAPDLVTLQIAALQQQLMVAALTCDDVSLYNSFVITYQKDLVASDQALQAFFDRFGNEEGMPAYHSFKTKMANLYSARSASDKKKFCTGARASFGPALKTQKMSLASFAMSQPSMVNEPYTNCGDSVAGGAMVAGTPVAAPAPAPSNLLTAQNAAQQAKGAAVAAATSTPPVTDTPLSAGVRVNTPAPPSGAAAGSAAVASAAPANSAAPPSGQVANPNATQERSPYYQGYGVGYARERERLAQQQREQANGSGAAAGAGVNNNAPSSSGQPANTYQDQQRSVTRSASEAYRERLAQQRAARERAAQRPAVRYRDRYDARGYFWPADPYWQYCYTRYGVRMSCAEAAQRFRSNQFYYRAPDDARGYFPSR